MNDEDAESSVESEIGLFVRREPCSRNDEHKPKWAYNLRTDRERNKKKNQRKQNNANIHVGSSNSISSVAIRKIQIMSQVSLNC